MEIAKRLRTIIIINAIRTLQFMLNKYSSTSFLTSPKNVLSMTSDQPLSDMQSHRVKLSKPDKVELSNETQNSHLSNESDPLPLSPVSGFQNPVWKERSLNVIVLVARFVTYLLTNSDKFKLRYLQLRQFVAIGDLAADYSYYLRHNLIRSRSRNSPLTLAWQRLEQCLSSLTQYGFKIDPIPPDNGFKLFWDTIVFLILLINLIYIPLKISFQLSDIPNGVDLFLDTLPQYVFIIEILLNFNVAYYSRGMLVLNQRQIVQHYLKGKFIVDFIGDQTSRMWNSSCFFEFLGQGPFVISCQVMSIFENLVDSLNLRLNFAYLIDITTLLSLFLFISHIIACVWHFLAVQESDYSGRRTWIEEAELTDGDWLERYLASFYWACITTLTIGYGDITPVTTLERVFVIFVTLCSSIVFGYTISSIGTIFAQMSERKKYLRDRMAMIDNFIKKRGIKKDLQVKVKKFFEYYFKMESDQETECEKMMQHLSSNLKQEVKVDFYRGLLMQSKVFKRNFSCDFVEQLCLKVREQSLVPEDTLFYEGQQVDKLYFILKGEIEASVGLNKVVRDYRKDQVINEKFFITQQAATFSTKAVKFTRIAYFTFNDFLDTLQVFPQDKENYFQLKHLIEFGARGKFQGCELCFQNHDFTKCPFVFYNPNVAKIFRVSRHSEDQSRGGTYVRKAREDSLQLKSLLNTRQIQKSALYFGNTQGLYQELSPNDQFYKSNHLWNKGTKSGIDVSVPLQDCAPSQDSDTESKFVSAADILESQMRNAKRHSSKEQDSLSQRNAVREQRVSLNGFMAIQNVTQTRVQPKRTTLLRQYKLQQSVKNHEPEAQSITLEEESSVRVDQVKMLEIEYANMIAEKECNIDAQVDMGFFGTEFNFDSVLKSLTKVRKKPILKRKKLRMKKSISELQGVSNKNLSQFEKN